MKTKILFLTMLAFAAMALAGCGNNSQTTANPPSDQQMPSPGASDNSAVTTNLDNTNTPASTNQ